METCPTIASIINSLITIYWTFGLEHLVWWQRDGCIDSFMEVDIGQMSEFWVKICKRAVCDFQGECVKGGSCSFEKDVAVQTLR
jgi:hypothetical protein